MSSTVQQTLDHIRTEEDLVLQECLLALQGIPGERVSFDRLQIPALLPPSLARHSKLGTSGTLDALSICLEAGWLYQRIQAYVPQGAVARAWASAVERELQDYREWLSTQNPPTLLALRRDLEPQIARLRTLASLTDAPSHDVLQPVPHGDSRHRQLVQKLQAAASKPWWEALYQWTTEGIITDDEFLVQRSSTSDNLWHDGFVVYPERATLLDADLVEPTVLVGKGIHFLRLHEREFQVERDESLSYREFITQASKTVHAHILESLKVEHSLMDHLRALKQFLLLGQGDFFSVLMDTMHAEYPKPGLVGVYRHSLVAMVEGALRSSNAVHFDPEILERLQVELRIDSGDSVRYMFGVASETEKDTRTVWDVFTLDYVLPEPLKAVVHGQAMEHYESLFFFLFGLRKVEHMLNHTWRQSAVLQHGELRWDDDLLWI